jgi:hypothetical protein
MQTSKTLRFNEKFSCNKMSKTVAAMPENGDGHG